MPVRLGVDQLDMHAHFVAGFAHTSFQNGGYAELLRDFPMGSAVFLKRCVDVREITFKSLMRDNLVRISSWIPSAKYAFALSSLRFSNASSSIDFLGTGAVTISIFSGIFA